MHSPHVLVLATADWDAPLWTNKQYVALELAREFRVTFVESLGLRQLKLSRADVSRTGRRLRRVARPTPVVGHRPRPTSLRVVSPAVIPLHGTRAAELANPMLLRRAVRDWLQSPRRVLWTFSPLTYGLEAFADATIYHSVDLIHEYPGHSRDVLVAGERRLSASASHAIASSEGVREHLLRTGFEDVDLCENVADVELYSAAASERSPGRAVFAGNLTPHKVDLDLMRELAGVCDLHVAGPVAIDGSCLDVERQLVAAGATMHGPLAPDDLAQLVASSCVGLIPYSVNAYTRGVFPMKLYEYLAAGAFVASTALPALRRHASQDVALSGSHEEFLAAVASNLDVPDAATVSRRQATAAGHSWHARGETLRELVRRV